MPAMPSGPPTVADRSPAHGALGISSEPVRIDEVESIDELVGSGFTERYEGMYTLGRGGMGEVLLVHDHRIGRAVAVKVGRAEDAPESLRRFLREARIQGQLDHPAVVPVYDIGVRPDGAIYFTMKRVRGVTLDAALAGLRRGEADAQRRWTRRRLLTAFLMVCQAVELAHARGVLHRDLKPSNIMLGDYGEVYVLDWGVAKLSSDPASEPGSSAPTLAAAADDEDLTVTGTFLGTPGYMPPEQAAGQVVDARADVFALGAVLFEMLTWHPLITRESREAVLAATLAGADARASLRHPERGVPPELEVACLRATAARADERTPTVAALRGAVEAFLDGDRDLERRELLADRLAGAADEALPRALAGDRAARGEALQLASRALALAPDHPRAQRVIVRLTLTPPAEPPPEVIAAVEDTERQTFALVARLTALLYLTWLPIGAIVLWMGLRDVTTFAVWGVLMIATSGVMYWGGQQGRYTARSYFIALVISSAAVATTSRLFGPYVLTPTLLTVNTIGFFLHSRPAWRPATVLIAVTAMLAPIALELVEVLPRTTTFAADQIVIHARAAEFGQPATSLALIGLMVAYAVVLGLTTARLRDRRVRDELRVQLGAWQLAQLVPEMRRPPTDPSPAAGARSGAVE
jgi:eukaryotic-like serine/threonine-protein kinase